MELLPVGTRIFYTGDMANIEDFGKVAKHNYDERFGSTMDLALDDGRCFRGITPASFNKSPGQRFKTEEEYYTEREVKIEAFKRSAGLLTMQSWTESKLDFGKYAKPDDK